ILPSGELEQPAFDVVVARLDRLDDVLHADVVGGQLVRIDVDLVLLDEAADARYFSDARHRRQPVPQVPVLEPTQVGEAVLTRLVDERVFEHPADARRGAPDDGSDAFGELPAGALQVLDHATARPVRVCTVLKVDGAVGALEVGDAAACL